MKLFLLIKYVEITEQNPSGFEFMGIFSTEEKAREICLSDKQYAICNFELDKAESDETTDAVEGKHFVYVV